MGDETFLNERVQVVVVFKAGNQPAQPVRFKRANGREVQVSELGLRHPEDRSGRLRHIFDVTDGGADYRLEFDAERLSWYLTMEADHYGA